MSVEFVFSSTEHDCMSVEFAFLSVEFGSMSVDCRPVGLERVGVLAEFLRAYGECGFHHLVAAAICWGIADGMAGSLFIPNSCPSSSITEMSRRRCHCGN